MQIKIQQLGLAAYVQMKGCPLSGMDGRQFIFESEKTAQQWRIEYSQSESQKHDALVCELRNLLKPAQSPT